MSIDLPKLQQLRTQIGKHSFTGRLIAVDPGETTGVTALLATPMGVELLYQQQLKTWPFEEAVHRFYDLLCTPSPDCLVYETYHVYKWRLAEHTFSQVPTIQIIGALKTWAVYFGVKYHEQTAQTGKAFFKDPMLKQLDMYFEGQPHARDSLRHAAQFLTFGPPKT